MTEVPETKIEMSILRETGRWTWFGVNSGETFGIGIYLGE